MSVDVILFIITACVVVPFMVFVLIDERRMRRRHRDRDIKRAEEAEAKAAAAYYSRWLAYGLDPVECEEFHLPGDCPLCGAD